MSGPKSFEISKHMVYEAYRRVKANKGAAGVDGQSIEQFEQGLKGNLYQAVECVQQDGRRGCDFM